MFLVEVVVLRPQQPGLLPQSLASVDELVNAVLEGLDVFVVHAVAPQKLGTGDNIRTGPGAGQRPRDKLGARLPPDAPVTETLPDYDELDTLLRAAGASASPSEVHGVLAGVLCAPEGAENAWCGLIFDDSMDGGGRAASGTAADDEAAAGALLLKRLAELLAQTRAMLADTEFGFVPLLPGEAGSLTQQLEGLTDWCRGFLLGFSAGGDRELRVLSPDDSRDGGGRAVSGTSAEAREFLEDMVRMSDAELEAEGADEEGEARALAELVEYLRAGVQLLHDERDTGRALH